jgi:environmental stress-induced protein Ves
MQIRLIRSDAHRVMPWKNGGGTTAEIALAPADADFASGRFDWRLSLASIERDGPFSAFPGVDRTIMLVEGAGMILTAADGARLVLDRSHLPQDFPGEWPVDCRLIGGPVRDLNLMANRARVRAVWQVIALDRKAATLPATAGTLIAHALDGRFELDGVAGRDGPVALAAGDTLIAEEVTTGSGLHARGTGVLFVAAIVRR